MPDPVETARKRFTEGLNCSQAVFAAFTSRHDLPEETALKIGSPFGGGIVRQGQTCGAVTGALMALGLEFGSSTPEGKVETYRISQVLLDRFRERHGSLLCKELLDCDISTPEGSTRAQEQGVFQNICPALVASAAELVNEMIQSRE
ncbi:MAG: C_GCAxxG_C_C family protein [Anaerolineales bacterium]|nr:C_GCAxxG_C_C family protein [Anaerolineales bacterium]